MGWRMGDGVGEDGRTSGQMMVVMMEAGTTMPPIPRPARTRRPQAR